VHTTVAHILNALTLLFSFIMVVGILLFQWSRETYSSISQQVFGADGPLMNSVWLDVNLRRSMMVLFMLLAAWIIVKEIRIPSIYKRLRWNCAVSIGLAAYSILLIYLIYAPVIQTG